jgi:hypothetical protein
MPAFRLLGLFAALTLSVAAAEPAPRNVILVTIDGVRWQDVFRGADDALMNKEHGGVPTGAMEKLRRDFGGDRAKDRREKLMPFLWGVVAAQGQLYGNRDLGSEAAVLNPHRVSYPGYNELLTGRVDPLIVSNALIPNPNVTVLEWLQSRPGFAGRVAASVEWTAFPAILNVGRSRLPLWVTHAASPPSLSTPRLRDIERLMADVPSLGHDEHFDAFVYHAAVELFEVRKPRVFFLAFGEPDVWAHQRRYDQYLYSIQRCDRFVRQLWDILQARPEYRGNTSLVITPDHGRGIDGSDWTGHGAKIPHAEETWLAVLGPHVPALGERRETIRVHQAQVAATVAALVGEDFGSAFPSAAAPLADAVRKAP